MELSTNVSSDNYHCNSIILSDGTIFIRGPDHREVKIPIHHHALISADTEIAV